MKNAMTVERIHAAIESARVSRGPRKGALKKTKPSGDAGAAWMAMMMHANPHKVPVFAMMTLTREEVWIFDQVRKALEGVPETGLDRDRDALEGLGVW